MAPRMTTFTGRVVNPLDLKPNDIVILDIAHHTATLNRFLGALKRPVSIAQHQVYVSRLLDGTGWEREGLFHDAIEAYLGDMLKWLKCEPEMKAYRDAEERGWLVACDALNLNPDGCPERCPEVEWADRLMVRYEAFREANNSDMFERPNYPKPSEDEIKKVGKWAPWSWRAAERGFLDHARLLGYTV